MAFLKTALAGSASILVLAANAHAAEFNIPGGDLKTALDAYSLQSGVSLIVSGDVVRGVQTRGAKGELTADAALSRILAGTGLVVHRHPSGAIAVVHETSVSKVHDVQLADAAPIHAASSVETVVVTSSKIKGDIQTVPIAITALSQEQLTSRQIAGGPDLVKEVPNLTFSKTNFTGYNIEIRGIGTQAISVTTDPAVAVAFNDTPFLRNHFFEQEFFDVSQVEVLRGPQGTLYGRNATAGVVNVVSAKPTDQFEAMLSADWGNYHNRRYEGMINLPIASDKLDLRIAGEWTKRDGYSFNTLTNEPIDGRDLWSARTTLRWHPVESVTVDAIWEHFSESDDRLRSSKQLCKRDDGPATVLGKATGIAGEAFLSQGCLPGSLYSADAYGVVNGFSLPYYGGLIGAGQNAAIIDPLDFNGEKRDPYASTTQSHNLRDIESSINPSYRAKNDTIELNADWNVTPSLTATSQTGYNNDFLRSTEDYNRFNTQPGIFNYRSTGNSAVLTTPDGNYRCIDTGEVTIGGNFCSSPNEGQATGIFCDPQLGCSNRLVAEDMSEEKSWQLSQELRLASNFSGPFNFSIGANYMHYETDENYYVLVNTLTMYAAVDGIGGRNANIPWVPGVSYNANCVRNGYQYPNLQKPQSVEACLGYIDPNPITSLNGQGHNYFRSNNPYVLNSYAGFGEAYYTVTPELKVTGGLRWSVDQKHFTEIPSELLVPFYGYPTTGVVNQKWSQWTGRSVVNWSPKLSFTDQSMFYASYAHGYKAGGANPPGAVLLSYSSGDITNPVHPATFKPEQIDAYELGTKNTLLDGGLTLNGNVFFYNYTGYQISEIVDRTAINLNFNATVKGAELEATWEPLPGLKFNFAGGYEDTRIDNGQSAVDLMDRTAGNPNWLMVKPFPTQASNCILPAYVVLALLNGHVGSVPGSCGIAYNDHLDPVTDLAYVANPTVSAGSGFVIPPGYAGFDPSTAPNNGEGFAKDVSGNQLPNAPHFTTSLSGDYTFPVSADWAATLHSDFYWQSQSFARVINDRPYDKIRGYSTTNVALILTDASGWQVMGYVKNIFDTTAITGDFLNSDDSGLTTNVFLTDPRLYGVRVTKHFDGGDLPGGGFDLFSGDGNKRPQIWLQLGGSLVQLGNAQQSYNPPFTARIPDSLPSPLEAEKTPAAAFDSEAKISYRPEGSDWVLKAGIRYGRSANNKHIHKSLPPTQNTYGTLAHKYQACHPLCTAPGNKFVDARSSASEQHTILDFTLGKDIGLGMFGGTGTSTIGGGVRLAQFTAHTRAEINSDPNYHFAPQKYQRYFDVFDGTTQEKRSFHGIGPELAWDASQPILGNASEGQITVDWGLNGAVLFGRQSANLHHKTAAAHGTLGQLHCPAANCYQLYPTRTPTISRSHRVTVPNLDGYIGASVVYQNAKISFGYRADEFFNAMDGGQDAAKKYDRGFYGPYLNLSIGFGG